MPTPIDEPREVEKNIDLRHLGKLGTALAEGLGASGVGGAAIEKGIVAGVQARCLSCGIGVSGDDLIAAALGVREGSELSEKQRRLRLGYCARKTCTASFYTVKLRPVTGLDWDRVWEHVEPTLVASAAATEARASGPSFVMQLIRLGEPIWRGLGRPLPLALIGVLLTGMWIRSGCRVPGISPPPKVFIVPETPVPRPAPRR